MHSFVHLSAKVGNKLGDKKKFIGEKANSNAQSVVHVKVHEYTGYLFRFVQWTILDILN